MIGKIKSRKDGYLLVEILISMSIFSVLAKLFEHSEFFVSSEKCRRLAIGCRICRNEQSYENKKEKT